MKNADSAQNSLRMIDRRWRKFQVQSMLGYTILIALCELAGYSILNAMGLVETSIQGYMLKYMLFPLACNSLLTFVSWLAAVKLPLSETAKTLLVNLTMTGMAFVVSVVHCIFPSIYAVFLVPIIMTTIYGKIHLTGVIALVCSALDLVSALFTHWDADKPTGAALTADLMLSQFLLAGVFVACTVIIRFEREKQRIIAHSEQERCRLQQELLKDNLTGVYNRLALDNALKSLRSASEEESFLAMMDVDNFKSINDLYGHIEGDAVLRYLGTVLKQDCPGAAPIRFGGDEFVVLFQSSGKEKAFAALQSVQLDFEKYHVKGLHPTLSIGLAKWHTGMLSEEILRRADEALYQSKLGTKNKITLYIPTAKPSGAAE
ncbi:MULTISPECIES: GGDEF domain-containing protein [Caproicibacterium]|uniref:GGDEF domain-containing protein n=1 Tax=Caproicibacterium argilliputei TaxID=3030016 RepID=A0AA97H2Z0_9FIRM|nr:GGDEF domain-containing protein [Caproicibacterium argilliputei]WOC33255.1 GGDEF domain-containing protein [Caproicibacterium argilliputei]